MPKQNTDEAEESTAVDHLTPEEVSRIIHSHRKVRYGTACWPCRQRKVKCDNQQPCENCVKREHPQLCSYKPNRISTSGKSVSNTEAGPSRKRARTSSNGLTKNERQDSWPRTIGSQEESDSAGDRYLGQNSIPALLREQSSPAYRNERASIRQDMRPILGLDTSAPFPLMSAAHLNLLARDIAGELPSDREVIKLFRTYKEIPQTFWGFVIDIDSFEAKLMVYLEDRSRNATSNVKSSSQVTASWLAILFSVLAVASQYHESPFHVRTKDSQKYIQISFHFLRLGNFLLRPSYDSIQALLLLNFVLLNDMKAEASWALNGLTCRLAQSLGLHRPNPQPDNAPPEIQKKEMIRRKLWWTCVWHDTLTSLSFDRSPMTNFSSCAIPSNTESADGNYSYLETMYHLIEIISRRLNPDLMAAASYSRIVENYQAVESLRSKVCAHIQNKEHCKTVLDRLQHFAIRLHTSFVISVACRPALRRDCHFEPEQRRDLSNKCKENLAETVRMFLAMHQLSVIPTRSWAFTYHGLSSALLLGILCETKADPEVRQLQGDLIAALSATAAKESSTPEPHVTTTDKDIELSGPLYRALTALKNIYDHGSLTGSGKRGSPAGARTPIASTSHPAGAITARDSNNNNQLPPISTGQYSAATLPASTDPRADAALAMASMQNGGMDFAHTPDMAPRTPWIQTPYTQQPSHDGLPVNVDMNTMAQINESNMMAPMDLYDTIWGESPQDAFGMDQMNFDFMAQPPPGQPQQQFYF